MSAMFALERAMPRFIASLQYASCFDYFAHFSCVMLLRAHYKVILGLRLFKTRREQRLYISHADAWLLAQPFYIL